MSAIKQQGFLKGSAILLGMVVITKAVGLAYKIPLTHLLGGSGMAYYSGAYAVFAPLMAAAVSGISASVARQTAEADAFGRYAQLRKVRRTAMLVYPALGLAAALVLTALSQPLAKAFLPSADARWTLCALAPSLWLCAVLSVQRGYYEGLRNMLPTARSEIVETVLRAVLGLAGAYAVLRYADADFAATHGCFGQFCRTAEDAAALALPFSAAAAILAGSLSTGIAVLTLGISFRLRGDGITEQMLASDPVTDPARDIVSRLFSHSLPIAGAAVITTLGGFIDLLTVPRGLRAAIAAGMSVPAGISEAALPDFIYGSYTGLALTVCGLVPTLTAMFGKSALPALTESSVRRSGGSLSRSVSGLILVSMFIALPCGAVLSALSRETLEFLFSGRSGEIGCTSAAMAVLGVGGCFMAVSLPCLSALQTLGCHLLPIVIMAAGSVIKLVLDLLLIPIPSLGIVGAAAAAAVSQAFICICSAGALLRRTHTYIPAQRFFRPILSGLLSAAAGRLVCDLAGQLLRGSIGSRLLFPISAAAAFLTAGLSLWLMDMLPKEKLRSIRRA